MSDLENDPRVEMEVTIKFKYKTDPANYELTGPAEKMLEEVANFDLDTFTTEPDELFDMMMAEDLDITVIPTIKDNNE